MFGAIHNVCRSCWRSLHKARTYSTINTQLTGHLTLSEEVASALHSGSPVVALETTIITHGMPHPHNLNMALEVEDIIRQQGATPASIGIIRGKLHVGMIKSQLEYLADPVTQAIKTSRRDLPYVIAQKCNGGTTVSGTMVASLIAGIPIFVTGGIGGVHRGAESSMDVSADLTELGRTPVAVVSAGVKSILDIGRTLEYLETEGVCVATYGPTKDFPAFFSRHSGYMAPYNVNTPLEAAQIIDSSHCLGIQTGTLIAVPIPTQFDVLGHEIQTVIQSVVMEAQEKKIMGKEVTPYILARVNELTKGQSLQANIHLVKNNAMVGSQIAMELSKLRQERQQCSHGDTNHTVYIAKATEVVAKENSDAMATEKPTVAREIVQRNKRSTNKTSSSGKKVVVVGGTIVDFYARMTSNNFEANGATYGGTVEQSFGGVGRNIADGLTRLGVNTHFISAVGNDSHRMAFEANCSHMDLSRVSRLDNASTATYCAILRPSGELMFGIGDMDIHTQVTPEYISQYEADLRTAEMVLIDGNMSVAAIEYVCNLCLHNQVPVFFEPTDIHKAAKPFMTTAHEGVIYTSPNFNELKTMVSYLRDEQLPVNGCVDDMDCDSVLHECIGLLDTVSNYIPVTMVTIGQHGVILCRHTDSRSSKFPVKGDVVKSSSRLVIEHYPATVPGREPAHITSVSGAGDCMVAAVIRNILDGCEPSMCIRGGLLAAQTSLQSPQAVPSTLTQDIVTLDNIQTYMNVKPNVIKMADNLT